MSIVAAFTTLRISLRNVFRAKTTEPLPWHADRPRSERYRASFALVHDEHGDEACIGCKMCEKICPSDIIRVVTGKKAESPNTGKNRSWCADFTLDLNACIICELCVQVCPTDAILMLREQEPPAFDRNDLVLTMERLYANEKKVAVTWATATKLIEMQDPDRPVPGADEAAEAAAAEAPAGEAG